ncbi:hypothetical protein PLIIFM63780_000135 [Purpureocillium lilacinum]|nr:hypothetical protein PLIIFM63780_000135 [Purpureocillium lilacinum]
MDSLGKAFKTGLAKAYAAGQQQVQQRVSKLQDQSSGSKPPQGYGYGGGQYGAGYYNAAPFLFAIPEPPLCTWASTCIRRPPDNI